MKENRTNNSLKNIIVNNIFQIFNLVLNFIVRTIFIKTLGNDYLGINGLFTNILSILSLAELGVGTAMVYSMYKPLAENNEEKLAALIGYYKKLYRRIAIVILICGMVILPVLPFIVNIESNIGNIYLYYILYLLSSVCSYLLLYKTSIVIASQKEYWIKKYEIFFVIIRNLLQAFILIVFKNYILYLLIQVITTILTNILKSRKAEKLYPFIKNKVELENSEKKEIWTNIKSLLFYQIGNVILNNTDNILISIICGTMYVGFYSNYSLIITTIVGFTSLIFTSMQASIGNYNVNGDGEGKYRIYKVLNYMAFIVYGFCSISLMLLMNDFITIWIGESYCLSIDIVIVIISNYYITGVLYPNWCFRYTTDLFNKAKYIITICAFLNIILSIILGVKFGLVGILAATGLSRLLTTFWYEAYILYKNIFNRNIREYFIMHFKYLMIVIFVTIVVMKISSFININMTILNMIIKEAIFTVLYILIFILPFVKTDEFKFLRSKIMTIINKTQK